VIIESAAAQIREVNVREKKSALPVLKLVFLHQLADFEVLLRRMRPEVRSRRSRRRPGGQTLRLHRPLVLPELPLERLGSHAGEDRSQLGLRPEVVVNVIT